MVVIFDCSMYFQSLYEYFDDSLAHCLPLVQTHMFKPVKEEHVVNLGDENTSKSGEKLLDNLKEQIKMEVCSHLHCLLLVLF